MMPTFILRRLPRGLLTVFYFSKALSTTGKYDIRLLRFYLMSDAARISQRKERLMAIGGVVGVALPVFFGIMWAAAVVVNGHWVLGEHTLSELGGNVSSRWIFNTAVIVGGLMGVDFSVGLMMRLAPSKTGRAGGALLAIASIGLITVGLFPIDTGESHTLATAFFFGFAALAAFVLSYPVYGWVGARGAPFIVLVVAIALSFASLALTPLPFAEAVAVASLMAMIFTMSLQMIGEKGWKLRTS
jgi:hypothetical membrane protein